MINTMARTDLGQRSRGFRMKGFRLGCMLLAQIRARTGVPRYWQKRCTQRPMMWRASKASYQNSPLLTGTCTSPRKSSKPTSSQFSFVPPCKLSRSLAILNPVSLTDGLRLLWMLCCWTKLLVLWPSTTYRTLWEIQQLTLSCEGRAEFDCSEMA